MPGLFKDPQKRHRGSKRALLAGAPSGAIRGPGGLEDAPGPIVGTDLAQKGGRSGSAQPSRSKPVGAELVTSLSPSHEPMTFSGLLGGSATGYRCC